MSRFLPLLLACALVPATARPQQRPDPGFRAWLWVPADQPRNEALAETLAALGFHGLSTEPGEDISRLKALGIPYYVDQLVGGGVLGLDQESWRRARAAALADPPHLHRPKCLHDPKVLNAAKAEIARRLAACADHPPAFVSLRDEPSFTSRLNPVDWCEALAARHGFVRFLENKWGSRDKIRDAWGLPGGVDLRTAGPLGSPPPALAPMRTQTARDRLFHGQPSARALVQWNDTRTFADRTFSAAVDTLASSARNALPGVPVGILGGQMPHTFGGFDWARLCRSLRLIEVYDHGGVREIARSFASPKTRFLSTLVTADPRPPQAVTHTAWHRLLQGDHEVVVYQSNDVFEERDPGRPTSWIQALSPHLKTMSGPDLAGWRRGQALDAQIAILTSMPSIRLHWLHDTRRDGLSWINRLTSHELAHSTQARNREAWTALLDDLGLRYRFVTPAQLADDVLTKQNFRALVLPRSIAMSAREVEKIKTFVSSGKLLIADCQPGLYTGQLVRRATPALDRLLGIRRKGRVVHLDGQRIVPRARNAGLPYPIAEPKLFAAGARPRHRADGVPAMLVGTPSNGPQGRTLYLNLLIFDYVRDRILDPTRARWLREQVGGVLRHGGVRPFARITRTPDAPPLPIGLRVRRDGSDLVVALHMNVITGSVPVPWERILKTPSIPVRVAFDGTWTVTDMLSRARLGTANRIEVSVPIDRPVLLRLSRQ